MIREDKHREHENNFHESNKSNKQNRGEGRNEELMSTVESLKRKVQAREDEIIRLHNKISYDGLNINKLIKDFQEREASQQV